MAGIVSGVQNSLKFLYVAGTTVLDVNYRIVSSLIKGATESYHWLKTVSIHFGNALTDILFYIGDFFVEFSQVIQSLVRLGGKLFLLVFYILRSTFHGLMYVLESIGACAAQGLMWIGDTSQAAWEYVTWVWGSTGADIALIFTKGQEGLTSLLNDVALLMKGYCIASAKAIVQGLNHFGEIINDGVSFIPGLTLNATRSLSGATTQLFSSVGETLGHGWGFACGFCSIFALSLWNGLRLILNSLVDSALNFVNYLTTSIPVQVYLYILGTTLIVVTFKIIMHHLHKHGMTFPLGDFRSSNRPHLHLINRRHFAIDSSDEESMYEEESYEDPELNEGQTVLDNLDNIPLFDMGVDFELNADDTDEDSDTTTNSISEEDEDDVEEYEVVTDSESEDGSEAPINIELPERGTRYNLRTRASPLPEDPFATDLGKVLENERDKRLCVVCQDQLKNVLVLPCRHMCLCVECAHEIAVQRNPARRVCPLCRSRIETVMDVYV